MYCLTPPMSEPPEGNNTFTCNKPTYPLHLELTLTFLRPLCRKLELPFVFGPAEREGFHIPEPERSAIMMEPLQNTGPAMSVPSCVHGHSVSEGSDLK